MNTPPTPPAGFKLLKGSQLTSPFDPKLMVFSREDEDWRESDYARNTRKEVMEVDLDSWYATPDHPTTPKCPQSLVDAAQKIVEERGQDYGDTQQSFERIAKFWSAYKGVEITPKDVAAMMMLLKISRWVTSDKPDTLLDIVGYAECAGRLKRAVLG